MNTIAENRHSYLCIWILAKWNGVVFVESFAFWLRSPFYSIASKTPPASPPPSVSEDPVTPRLPISPPVIARTDPSPRSISYRSPSPLNLIRLYCRGYLSGTTWSRFCISRDTYRELQNALGKDRLEARVADKFPYDYDPVSGELLLRMPSPLDE